MSKHIGRKQRWSQRDSRTWLSALGPVAYRQDAWYAHLVYRTREPTADGLPQWQTHDRWLGPFKRPRNAMVELEREAAVLRNRFGTDVQIGDEIDGE